MAKQRLSHDVKTYPKPKPNLPPRIVTKAQIMLNLAASDPNQPIQWPLHVAQVLQPLNPRQLHFTFLRASGMPQLGAYRIAYEAPDDGNPSTQSATASEIANNPSVSQAIRTILDWVSRDWLIEADEVLQYGYARLYEEAEYGTRAADRIAATIALMKAHGAFINRSEVKHIHTVDSPMSDLIEGLSSMLGLAQPVPKTPAQIEPASVASVEFVEPE